MPPRLENHCGGPACHIRCRIPVGASLLAMGSATFNIVGA